MKRIFSNFLIPLLLVVSALSTATAADESDIVRQQVVDNTDSLVAQLQQEKESYHSDPEKFYAVMDKALTEVIDFRRIAARVMGFYRKEASGNQKDDFVGIFKKSLLNAYGKMLVESGDFEIDVLAAEMDLRKSDRASVNLEITTSSGNKYPVIYSMYKNRQSQKWLLENIIINNSFNIGLTFREQFKQDYETFNGDLDQVIAQWSSQLSKDETSQE